MIAKEMNNPISKFYAKEWWVQPNLHYWLNLKVEFTTCNQDEVTILVNLNENTL